MPKKNVEEVPEAPKEKAAPIGPRSVKRFLKMMAVIAGIFVLVIAGLRAYQYVVTPAVIRNPTVDHYHFRTQLLYDGQAVNFAEPRFQETYEGGQCSADLPDTPVHFHDETDQMTHIHWNGITGGMMLKYYGLNLIGGPEGRLGWKMSSNLMSAQPVPNRTDSLPEVPEGHEIYVFIKTTDGFKEKPISEFLEQDLETFFEKKSNLGTAPEGLLDWLFPKAQAHGDGDGHELEALNNLVGDVAIYIQPERPSDEQITEAFENLIELPESTCGG